MKKIKLPLEMANGVMVRTLDELKENWDLEKIVGYFCDGRLVTWLNDRYYTDLAEQVEKITAKGAEAQKELCAIFGVDFKQDEVVDAEALAERKRKLDILRQFTSDDEILKNVDHVAFNQEDLADLLDEGVEKIYLCNGKFSVPLNISGKKYIGVADAEVYIGKDELQDFDKLGIGFENVKFDEKYQKLVEEKEELERKKKQEEIEREKALNAKKPGQIIKLGNYQGEDIEWIILEVDAGKAKVLSRYVLEYLPYDDTYEYGTYDYKDFCSWQSKVTWETCSLRRWLNGDFYNSTFNDTEKDIICVSDIVSKGVIGGDTWVKVTCRTKDRIFIMDYDDLGKLEYSERTNDDFSKILPHNSGGYCKYGFNEPIGRIYEDLRKRVETTGDCLHVMWDEEPYDVCCWVRFSDRNPGNSPMWRGDTQGIIYFGSDICYCAGVRPVMWIDLEKM